MCACTHTQIAHNNVLLSESMWREWTMIGIIISTQDMVHVIN